MSRAKFTRHIGTLPRQAGLGVLLLVFVVVTLMACSKWQVQGEQTTGAAAPVAVAPGAARAVSSGGASSAATPSPNAARSSDVIAMTKTKFEKPSDESLRQRLDPLAYEVTQHAQTEPPFRNRYWNHHESGIYVDVVSGEPLFSSTDKFDSGTGWPSFSAPIASGVVTEHSDDSLGMRRTEVLSTKAGSHLGHVFDDGPGPNGLRYCINSAALRFVPRARLIAEGYSDYVSLFASADEAGPTVPSVAAPNSCSAPPAGTGPGCRATLEEAYLAGGCFWGMQDILRKIPGVISTAVGYMGGSTPNPTYDTVHLGVTGHAESVRITFDPARLSYSDLLEKWFFRMHDPTSKNRQGNDSGTQYRSAIFVTSAEQRATALTVIDRVNASGLWSSPIVTEVSSAGSFTLAEDYHQDYLVKHPGGYTCHYLR